MTVCPEPTAATLHAALAATTHTDQKARMATLLSTQEDA